MFSTNNDTITNVSNSSYKAGTEMTHNELLARIANLSCCSGVHELALSAVVEFHRPIEIKDMMTYCQGCSNSALFAWESCLTIQAIEKELK